MKWFLIYLAYVVMMLPIVAVPVFLVHDWWKRTKESDHGKRE